MILVEQQNILTLEEVSQRLDHAGITWAIFAGAAAIMYGANRPLTDIDILISSTDGERAAAEFDEGQVCYRGDGSVEGVKLPGYDLIAGLTNGYSLDLDVDMAARLRRSEINGVSVPFIPPEDNILIKAIWGRGPEIGKHDWEDVQAMIAHNRTIDWEYLCSRAASGLSPDRVEKVLARLETMWLELWDDVTNRSGG